MQKIISEFLLTKKFVPDFPYQPISYYKEQLQKLAPQ